MLEYVLGGVLAFGLVVGIYGGMIYLAFKMRKDDEKYAEWDEYDNWL